MRQPRFSAGPVTVATGNSRYLVRETPVRLCFFAVMAAVAARSLVAHAFMRRVR